MTRLAPLWQQNGSYPANTDRVLLATLWPNAGVVGGAVTAQANTMNVNIAAGTAAVPLGPSAANYTALCRWDATEVITLTAAPPSGQSRVDLIVLQVRDAALDAGSNNDFVFQAIAGTPAVSNPTVPATPANALAVAQVTVPGGAANLNGATIVDRRTPLYPRDIVHARVYRNAAYTVGTASAVIPMDTVDYDPAGMFRAGGSIVVPVAGIYLLAGQWTTLNNINTGSYAIWTQRNGGTVSYQNQSPTGANWQTFATVGSEKCAAGDTITLAASANPAQGAAPGNVNTWLSVDYLGTG